MVTPTPAGTGDALCDDVDEWVVGVGGDAVAAVPTFNGDVDAFVGESFEELCDDGNNGLSRLSFSILFVYLT